MSYQIYQANSHQPSHITHVLIGVRGLKRDTRLEIQSDQDAQVSTTVVAGGAATTAINQTHKSQSPPPAPLMDDNEEHFEVLAINEFDSHRFD